MPPASMAKLMTTAVVFDAIKAGKLSLDDEFVVSENAWRNGGANSGGSTMFAKLGSSIKVDDLIQRHHHPVGQRRLHRDRRGHGGHRGDASPI